MIVEVHKGTGESELKRICVQLVLIKYILAGILGLAVVGRTGSLAGDVGIIANVFLYVFLFEYSAMTVLKLPTALNEWKAARARSEARLNALLAECRNLEQEDTETPDSEDAEKL